jgi:hypothetical protein
MDIVSAENHLSTVLQSVHRFSHDAGKELLFWLTAGQVSRFRECDPVIDSLGIEIPCNRWSDGPATETLMAAWWLTAGDMDFM